MEFKQGLQLGTRLEQRLVMTQQLQQAIRLLALSRHELLETVRDTLNENPLLEESPQRSDEASSNSLTGGEGEVTHFESTPGKEKSSSEIDWQEYFADLARGPTSGPSGYASRDEELPPLSATLTRDLTIEEELFEQLGLMGMTDKQLEIAEEIVGNLDEEGYFRPSRLELRGGTDAGRRLLRRKADIAGIETDDVPNGLDLLWLADEEIEEWRHEAEGRGMKSEAVAGNSTRALARDHNVEVAVVGEVLAAVQRCEPLGVAARDLTQCLSIQAHALFPEQPKLHRLIERHLHNLELRKQAPILRDLKATEDEVRALLAMLSTLEPRPGRRYSGESARYITPDVYVHKMGDDYNVVVNEDGLPKLRVSNFYRRALTDTTGAEAKEYLSEKMRQAIWMIRSIHQRQSTIQKVTESIMRFQRAFLDNGISHLRPLVLREIAEDVGLHESTVSRVTTSKYVHTPQGIFELKYFFNSRITSEGGPDLASEAVKHAIKRLIEREPGRSPLSDQEIAEILQGHWDRARLLARLDIEEGQIASLLPDKTLSIARRTVAKYREALNIPPSSQRRALM